MQNFQEDRSIKFKQKDLILFKNLSLFFALSTIGAFGIALIPNLKFIDTYITTIGIVALTIGFYFFANKYPEVKSDPKVGLFLIFLIGVHLIGIIINFLYPVNTSSTGTITDKLTLIAKFKDVSIIFLISGVIAGIVTVVATYYYTNWFNDIFGTYNPTKTFYYYGIFSLITSLILGLGTYTLINEVANLSPTQIANFSSNDLSLISTGILFVFIGGIFAIITVIFLVVSGFKLYNRVNDKVLGKVPNSQTQTSYGSPYQPQYSPKYITNNQPQNTSFSNTDNSVNSCNNCGNVLDIGSQFCPNCGYKV